MACSSPQAEAQCWGRRELRFLGDIKASVPTRVPAQRWVGSQAPADTRPPCSRFLLEIGMAAESAQFRGDAFLSCPQRMLRADVCSCKE